MQQRKMATIKTIDGVILRVYADVAEEYVKEGKAYYTTKSSLKKFWKDVAKIERNRNFVGRFNFDKKQNENFIRKEGNKVFAYVLRKRYQKLLVGIEQSS